ncbi:MAG TPA: AIR synthase-related protein, partial [Candidatus Hydrogenedentes bacterium]|nr:AIR synthase-related protein [Candidatus Hydrogenedentota bacterium]
GSEYLALKGRLGTTVPKVVPMKAKRLYTALSRAIGQGLVASCHDCSDGGLGVALAESAFAGGHGLSLDLAPIGAPNMTVALFSESQSRFVVTVKPSDAPAFESALDNCPVTRVGVVRDDDRFEIENGICATIGELKEAWQRPLRW